MIIVKEGSYLILGKEKKREEKIDQILSRLGVEKENNPDLFLLDQAAVGIQSIREVKKLLSLKRWGGEKKIVVIKKGERLTPEAQNALLKTLEEAKENQIIIIGAEKKESLLPTIVSRCQVITLGREEKGEDLFNWSRLLSLPLGEKFAWIEKEIKPGKMSSEEAISWLEQLIVQAQKKLIEEKRPSFWGKIITLLQRSQALVENNLSPQTAVDWFLLNL